MSDVLAISILTQKIKQFQALQDPPADLKAVGPYTTKLEKVIQSTQGEVQKVNKYIQQIEVKLRELRTEQETVIKKNQAAIKKIFDRLKSGGGSISSGDRRDYNSGISAGIEENLERYQNESGKGSSSHRNQTELEHALALLKATQNLQNDRLRELIDETSLACAKVKDGVALTEKDIANLIGCLESWKGAKKESHEQEERRKKKEEEKKKNEEKQRKDEKDDAERKRKEAKNLKLSKQQEKEKEAKKQEEERLKEREEEERNNAEKESKLIEEEERRKQLVEEERERTEAERKQIEVEERKQMEEIERMKREEEERINKQTEEEARKLRDEAAKKEAEERQRLHDPNNWTPFLFQRSNDKVSGRIAFHRGISCIMTSPKGGITEDDLDCTASDELDSIIDILRDEETPVSSLTGVRSKKHSLKSEPSSRIYVPHIPLLGSDEEIVVKTSVNGSDWVTSSPLPSTINVAKHESSNLKMAGFEVNNFTTVMAIVVSRPRCQMIEVDKPGISVSSTADKHLKIFVPRDAFQSKTKLELTVQSVTDDILASITTENPGLKNVLSVSAFVSLFSNNKPEKSIEFDFNNYQKNGSRKRGKPYMLYACKDKVWRFADVEYKSHNDDLTVTLPKGETKHIVMEVVVPPTVSKETLLKMMPDLYSSMRCTKVRMIVKQKSDDEENCTVCVVHDQQWKEMIQRIAENGYTAGPDVSAVFSIQEGQRLNITCAGNVETQEKMFSLVYFTFLGGVHENLTLRVLDTWKQKDMPSFVGSIVCSVLNDNDSVVRSVHLQVSLPKKKRAGISYAPVRFPYYLTSLACFLSQTLCKEGDVWQAVLSSILGDDKFKSIHRNVKRKITDSSPEKICKAMLLDWMKGQAAHIDKIVPVLNALETQKMKDAADSCQDFVHYHKERKSLVTIQKGEICISGIATFKKTASPHSQEEERGREHEHLTDDAMKTLAFGTTKDVRIIGQDLELDNTEVERCINEHTNNKQEQKLALLMVWRESDSVVKYGKRALDHLKTVCA